MFTGEINTILTEHKDVVHSIHFSPTSPLMVSKSWDNTVRLWRTDTWISVASLDESTPSHGTASPAFHPTGPVVATTGANDTEVHIWRMDYKILLSDK